MGGKGTAAALVSGGVESGALLRVGLTRYARVTPLYIRTGLRWETAELTWLRRLVTALETPALQPTVVLELPVHDVYGRHWSVSGRGVPNAASPDPAVYLPGRNLLLLSKAAVYAARNGINTLLLGTLKDNPFPDATTPFFSAMAEAIDLALDTPLRIETPFRHLHKIDVLRRYDVPWGLTFSCIRPAGTRHCGRCNKCAERQRAFLGAGIDDPTRYSH
jgi:7-cyano-7-deazaguanine synthase